MSIDISLIPQERIKDLVSTLDTIQSNISTIDGNLTTTTSNLSTLQNNVTDNYTTLDNKIDSESSRIINIMDSSCVHKTGDETINGIKTYNNMIEFKNNGGVWSTSNKENWQDNRYCCKFYQYGLSDNILPQNPVYSGIHCFDKNNFEYGTIFSYIHPTGIVGTYLWVHTPNSSPAQIGVYKSSDGTTYTEAPTPPASDNGSQIATTNWSRMVHPTYPNITTSTRVSVPANTDYSIPYDCWVWWGNTSYVGVRYLYVNGIEFGHSYGNSGHWEEFNTLFFPIKAGNVIRHTGENSTCFLYQNVY